MKHKYKRLSLVLLSLLLFGAATGLILAAFEDNIVFFYSPTDLGVKKPAPHQRLRIGGLVERGSVEKSSKGVVAFTITDTSQNIQVRYKGILPDLFREGQGVVAEGYLSGPLFLAEQVLAKHDENYMPPEVADAIKKSGNWKPGKASK